jgi:hypothetical protein
MYVRTYMHIYIYIHTYICACTYVRTYFRSFVRLLALCTYIFAFQSSNCDSLSQTMIERVQLCFKTSLLTFESVPVTFKISTNRKHASFGHTCTYVTLDSTNYIIVRSCTDCRFIHTKDTRRVSSSH